ncbi:MAG TPA: DUF1501 domain-containing protein [Gemmataceae bacterium]|nr:DUF1501 domain-containing protein [Gemmataceae bacterium]
MLHQPSRRDLLKLAAAGVATASASGWFGLLADRAARAASQGAKHKSCILLWMQGGPAQSHTFDLKPGGDYKPISTSVPGIQISEHLPKIAKQMHNLSLLRSMKTGDGNHRTATYLMHTGFRQGSGGGLVHPSLGAIVANELGQPGFELPNYVAVGNGLGPGYLGPKFAPLVVNDFEKGLPDLKPFGGGSDVNERVSLVEELDKAFLSDYGANSTKAHQASMQKALDLMHSDKTSAFELSREKDLTRDLYGRSKFGQGCLLARRLVEVGVPFVEVTLGGWDTHQGATQRVKALSEQLDPGMAALIADLKDRGLLDSTLVIWMGEFGRAPKTGSNHYARAWTSILAGAGLKVGQVVGSTDASGADVKDRPISSGDFMATVCSALGIDYTKEYVARGNRPMHKVDKNAKPVTQVL